MRLIVLLASLLPLAASAQYRFEEAVGLDHRGQWGLRVEPAALLIVSSGFTEEAGGAALGVGALDLGASYGIGDDGDEVSIRLRPLVVGTRGLMLLGGYRSYAGREHWKTFVDLDLLVPVIPGPSAGARLGVGVMYDPTRHVGVSLMVGAFAALGARAVTGFDSALGVQLRF